MMRLYECSTEREIWMPGSGIAQTTARAAFIHTNVCTQDFGEKCVILVVFEGFEGLKILPRSPQKCYIKSRYAHVENHDVQIISLLFLALFRSILHHRICPILHDIESKRGARRRFHYPPDAVVSILRDGARA